MAEFTLQEIIDATSGSCKGDVSLQFKDVYFCININSYQIFLY